MKIEIERKGDNYHFEAGNESGNIVSMDSSPEAGGADLGMRPMQMLLAALGGCASIDVIAILKKQKKNPVAYRVTVTAERVQNQVPALFESIHLHFVISGGPDEKQLERAIQLSVDKYCSVAKIIEKTAKITFSYEVQA